MIQQDSIGVAVRVRPLLKRETDDDSKPLVEMPGDGKVKLYPPNDTRTLQQFQFDDAIWSFDGDIVNNKQLYTNSRPQLITHFFKGYNACLLAYGQTSSGKTFTMMGDEADPGFIPLLMKDILVYKENAVSEKLNCQIKLSYIEVYNERVRDLLYQGLEPQKWRVREHPETGPYVDNLKHHTIETIDEFYDLLKIGNSTRKTASTSMNSQSSRSHAILDIKLIQTQFLDSMKVDTEVVSNIKLVDLAGSERLSRTQVFGQKERIKEGTQINKSLAVLGRCINALSKNSSTSSNDLVLYRESILTYLLKENLGGNSRTMMIFCISPVDYDETLQTLNYANRVKQIKTKIKVNANKLVDIEPNWHEEKSVVESLQDEIIKLTNRLNESESEKLSNMVKYLEKRFDNSRFENRLLTDKLEQLEEENEELRKHNQFITNKLLSQTSASNYNHKQNLIQQLKTHQQELAQVLHEMLPTFMRE